ncbi:hypothetical protein BH11PSE8_BH11PSE8_40320 [soil metagenome]
MMMITAILSHTPIWVWALLAALLAIGLAQTKTREVSLTRITVLPVILLVLSVAGVFTAFGHQPLALGAWAAGLAASLTLARSWVAVRTASWSPATQRLHVPGSWLPLTLIVGLFMIKYMVGVTLAMEPAMAHNATFAGCCGLAYGGFSGLFAARALSLRALATRSATNSGAQTA